MSKKIIFIAVLLLSSAIALAQVKKDIETKSNNQNAKLQVPGECISGYGYLDNDVDGYGAGPLTCLDSVFDENLIYVNQSGDCDDNNPLVAIAQFWYQDIDGDGYGGTSTPTKLCYAPAGYIAVGGDCIDTISFINPNTYWYYDADQDQFGSSIIPAFIGCYPPIQTSIYCLNNSDCNDSDASINANTIWYFDGDQDGYGNPAIFLTQCNQPINHVLNNTDCNDNDAALNIVKTWYQDSDLDGFGNPAATLSSCTQPVGYVDNNLDTCPTIAGTFQGCLVPNSTTLFGDRNYIITTTPKVQVTDILNITQAKDVLVSITYYDELGKPNQQIENQQSNTGKDIITHIEYDAYNRKVKDFLPFKSNSKTMAFDTNALAGSLNYPDYTGQNPYSEKLFENSPLNRTLKQAAPGTINDWAMGSNHEISFDYLTNTLTDNVKIYTANAIWNATSKIFDISFSQSGTTDYPANELFKTVNKDENANSVEEFKDKEGKVILKRTYATVGSGTTLERHDTYYVYDQYSNLTYVIPPLVANITTQLNDLCYQYKYDLRNRLVEKKLPGKQLEFIVYDKIDRVVATGPALSPFPNLVASGWLITKYDVFNRPILTAWQQASITSTTRTTLQASYNLAATIVSETKNATATDSPAINNVACRYSNVALPKTNYHTLTVNYYDDYNFSFAPTIPAMVENQAVFYDNTTKPIGLNTGSWVRVLENSTTVPVKSESNYSLFDSKSRAIRTFKFNHLGGFTQVDSNFKPLTGRLEYSVTSHSRASLTTGILISKDEFSYSNQDRLLIHTNQINGGTKQLIASNSYNELGDLISKYVGGTDTTGASGLQKVDYSYNIRGWLTGINNDATNNIVLNTSENDLFAFKINYATVEGIAPGIVPLFNGNISETYWRSKNGNNIRKYGYRYDNLNRLKEAIYQKPDIFNPVTNYFNESLTYDKNGNIMTLIRNSASPLDAAPLLIIDNLTYTYQLNSNRLAKVSDNPTTATSGFKDGTNTNDDYSYDANGNMTIDQNKGITTAINYNHLNLPHKITFGTTGNITYLYNAIGVKVGKTVVTNTPPGSNSTIYLDGFQYLNNVLQFIPHAEGYVNATSYVFQYKDHLGNVRLSYADTAPKDGTISLSEIIEENNYYPFGLKHSGYNSTFSGGNSEGQKYKYNGKELQDDLSLGMYDYGARFYDPVVPRFWQIDPLAEKSRRYSPYSYALDNPVYYIDRDGMYADTNAVPDETSQCCPGYPTNNPPKNTSPLGGTMQNFTPSDKTMSLLSEGKELLSNVFGYEASVSAGYSIGASGTVGPAKVEAEVSVAEVSVKTNEKSLVEAKVEGAGGKASASVGDAKAEVKGSTGSTKVAVDKKLNAKTSSEGAKASGTATMGKNNKLSLSNSITLSASVKVPTPEGVSAKVGVSVNLYNAGKGVVKMIEGGVSYLSDYVSNVFSWN